MSDQFILTVWNDIISRPEGVYIQLQIIYFIKKLLYGMS
jgi:hypothetical protein